MVGVPGVGDGGKAEAGKDLVAAGQIGLDRVDQQRAQVVVLVHQDRGEEIAHLFLSVGRPRQQLHRLHVPKVEFIAEKDTEDQFGCAQQPKGGGGRNREGGVISERARVIHASTSHPLRSPSHATRKRTHVFLLVVGVKGLVRPLHPCHGNERRRLVPPGV